MMAQRPTADYSFQVDWSTNEGDNVKKQSEDEDGIQSIQTRDFEESLRRLTPHLNDSSSNRFYTPMDFQELPFMRVHNQDGRTSPLSIGNNVNEAEVSVQNQNQEPDAPLLSIANNVFEVDVAVQNQNQNGAQPQAPLLSIPNNVNEVEVPVENQNQNVAQPQAPPLSIGNNVNEVELLTQNQNGAQPQAPLLSIPNNVNEVEVPVENQNQNVAQPQAPIFSVDNNVKEVELADQNQNGTQSQAPPLSTGNNVNEAEMLVQNQNVAQPQLPLLSIGNNVYEMEVPAQNQNGAQPQTPPLSIGNKVNEVEMPVQNQNDAHSPAPPPSSGVVSGAADESFKNVTSVIEAYQHPIPEQYDVENISNILKTVQFNQFLNTSIIKTEMKEEPPDWPQLHHNEENFHPVRDGDFKMEIKEEEPVFTTVKTEMDIEAELPCTSIKQRATPKRKPAKSRKNVGSKTLENPRKPTKECAKRTSKRKTNYCEDTSSEDEKKPLKSKYITQAIKTEPKTIPVLEKKTLKSKSKYPIKTEPNTIAVHFQEPHMFQVEDEFKKEPPDVKKEEQVEVDNVHGLKTSDLLTYVKSEVKDEGLQEVKKEPNSKSKRVRNPAAFGASRGKQRLHPLTRKEQTMMNKLMESKQPFLQNMPCLKLASRISKCRECRCSSLRSDSVFCRFYDFRRLRFNENGILVVDGFSDPNTDPAANDVALWMPGPPPRDMDLEASRFILMYVADQFCHIWQEEQTAITEHMSTDPTIAWKKVVKGVREICDVCETTLFNFHWTCSKCGFGVCIDCYKDRKRKLTKKVDRPQRGIDDYGWLVCTFRVSHDQNTLMLTQIIPGNCLNILARRLHEVCRIWKIPQKCECPLLTGMEEEVLLPRYFEISNTIIKDAYLRFYTRECEMKYRAKIRNLNLDNDEDQMVLHEAETDLLDEALSAGTLPVVLASTLKHLEMKPNVETLSSKPTLEEVKDTVTMEYNATRENGKRRQQYMAPKIMTWMMTRQLFPMIDHDWLCNGKLLRLVDPRNKRNVLVFQEVWRRGQPVMFSELCKFLHLSLWHPQAFCQDFGEQKNDLINCMTGNLVPNQPMKHFWEGFECVSKRLLDAQGQPMLLKLKDWPPGDDFAEILPTRFADLMNALPMPEYTLRTGTLNIASRLPSIFVPPDLGPKMYNAYGSALHPDKGTTNLHLDISDAVNVMVYVGVPNDASAKAQVTAALRAIDSGGCDVVTRHRARLPGVMPGALWHIYSARDADKIRDLLNRVTIERGFRLEPDHDPIHDQNWYLDNELRERLYDEYGVEGYPIVQCLGDAVFIPAGAPHQVRNLHNCIKVAEDFVSPENIQHCFHLSQQFRKLSMSHTNHEDKLQIRNVIYHAVKDTTSYLTFLLSRHM